jgi:hypothetical protein
MRLRLSYWSPWLSPTDVFRSDFALTHNQPLGLTAGAQDFPNSYTF